MSPLSLFDATNTVPLGDVASVATATNRILEQCFGKGSFDSKLLCSSFAFVGRMFAGEQPGYLACDMPYHDLRHSLDTTLVMGRLIAGYQSERGGSSDALAPEHGLVGVLLALLHDTGYLRTASEHALCGPQLMPRHESRGVEFAASHLRGTPLARHATLATLICATRMGIDFDAFFAEHEGAAVTLGQMLGSADLLSQMADRCYLERCYYHLYPELVLAAADRVRTPDGRQTILYRDALDLLGRTPQFYETVVRKRLDHDFKGATRYLGVHFGGADPYVPAIRSNLERAQRIVVENRLELLGPEPPTTTRNLAAIYHGRPPRGPSAR